MSKIAMRFPDREKTVEFDENIIVEFEALEFARTYDIYRDEIPSGAWRKNECTRFTEATAKRYESAWLCRSGLSITEASRIINAAWESFLEAQNEVSGSKDVEEVLLKRPQFLKDNRARDGLTGRLSR